MAVDSPIWVSMERLLPVLVLGSALPVTDFAAWEVGITKCEGNVKHKIFEVVFSYRTKSPGPIRGSIKPFIFEAIFHRAIHILKRLPVVRNAGELRIQESRIPGIGCPRNE